MRFIKIAVFLQQIPNAVRKVFDFFLISKYLQYFFASLPFSEPEKILYMPTCQKRSWCSLTKGFIPLSAPNMLFFLSLFFIIDKHSHVNYLNISLSLRKYNKLSPAVLGSPSRYAFLYLLRLPAILLRLM